MSAIAWVLVFTTTLEAAGPADCPLTDNRCKAELFVRRATAAASSAVRAKYLEAAHGSFLASYDASGEVRDLCAARKTFEQTLAAIGQDEVPRRLVPLREALEKREQVRRPRCGSNGRKSSRASAVVRPAPVDVAPARTDSPPPRAAEHTDELLPVPAATAVLRREPTVLAATETRPVGPPAATVVVPRASDSMRDASVRGDRRLVIAGSVTVGLGLSLIGVAGYAIGERIETKRASLELLAEAQGHANEEQIARSVDLRDRYQTMGHLALGTSLAGGAAVIVGTTLAIVGGRRLARLARRVSLMPAPGGIAIGARF